MNDMKPGNGAQVSEVLAAFSAAMRPVLDHVAKNMEAIQRILVDAGLASAPLPEAPRERALHLRKHRNTGPGKPIQEQRRRR